MKLQNSGFLSIEQLKDQYLNSQNVTKPSAQKDGMSFQEILQKQSGSGEVKFSKHAAGRLAERNIELTNAQMARLQEGAEKAGEKGIKESLVIVDQLAFIVNIPNNTVITAMHQQDTMENVFTNIDGAVIM